MRQTIFLFTIFAIAWTSIMVTTAENDLSTAIDPILIYQSGHVISIDPYSGNQHEQAQFSTDFMMDTDSIALWSEFDNLHNQIYMLVEAEDWNPRQLRNIVRLDLTHSTVDVLLTDRNLVNGYLSPDREKLLIHQYKFTDDGAAILPSRSQVCILNTTTPMCQMIEIEGITSHFVWINDSIFITPALGVLYVCNVKELYCERASALDDIYDERVSKTEQPDRILIAAQINEYDGTTHYFYYDLTTHRRTEIEKLIKMPIYTSDNLAVIQDSIGYMELSANGKYMIVTNQLIQSEIRIVDVSTGTPIATYNGNHPQWVGDSNLLVDVTYKENMGEVYSLDIEMGKRTTLFTSDKPFNVIVP